MAYDFSRITERVFVGAQISGPADVTDLKAAGVTHVIDANTDDETGDFPATGSIFLLSNPTQDDGSHKPVEWFRVAVSFGIRALGLPGSIVLAHCAAGVNRGPSLALAIMRAQGFGYGQAFALMKLARPQVIACYRDDAEAALVKLGWIKQAGAV
jgi:protein tyrosine phosphatase (PTP) superfamily phosphohydrolase (DUF442 family)